MEGFDVSLSWESWDFNLRAKQIGVRSIMSSHSEYDHGLFLRARFKIWLLSI
uniref:Uncharacterized protein n=1 Tax=Rhizophora mucronata TaxID=61149 RepID=A0A2P2P2K8_RHIMU